jgi:cyclopropane-fatty-acyl-phospholipid synthase
LLLLSALLKRVIKVGHLTVVDHTGRAHVFAGGPGPVAAIRLHDASAARQIARNPRLYFGETYMDGRMTIESGDIYSFLDFCAHNEAQVTPGSWMDFVYRLQALVRRFQQINPASRARENVAHHYDLSGRLYELFLDTDRQYSCAYFRTENDTLEAAQENKKRHIAAKLLLKPGSKVLDIGSGWGGLGLYLAKVGTCDVTGITLSAEQHKVSNERAAAAGMAARARFQLTDYRQQTGTFDRIVSVGMFEHVGVNHYRQFFKSLRDLLTEGGVALVHSIGRLDGPGVTNPWLRKYIFPGGYSPALSEVLPVVEKSGLFVTDVEILRLHYAETLRAWRERFARARDQIRELYDERFCRMWEFYLAGSELAFRYHGHVVWQMQLAKRIDTVPLTRDYMFEWEREDVGRGGTRAA